MESQHQHTVEIQDPGAKAAPSSRRTRGFGSLVSAVGVVLVLVTMAVWWLSRELDERVLVAAQPYLATDVRIGSVEVSLWSSWPNVEVVLRDVWVEDAIHRGEAFLEMERVGVVMACWPLISGRMEVQEVRAEQGKVNLERSSDGRENWRFWKAEEGVDGDNEGMEWGLEAFRLDEVQVEGSWWQTGSASAVTWSANCRAMSGWLDGPSEDSEAFMVSAESDLFVASFSATGKEWLRQVEVSGEVEMELNGGELWVGLDDATVTTDQGPVRIQGEFSDEGGFSMALVSEPAAVKALMAMVPEGIFGQIEEGKMPEGLVAVDVRVGLGGGRSAWSGPVDESWSGSWAVRIRPEELKGGVEGVEYSWISGEAVVHDIRGGWRVQAEGLRAKLAEGEAGGDFTWTNSGRQERLEGHVEWRIRLHRLCEDWDRLRTVLEPWRVGEGSVFAGGADGVLERRTPGGPWEWSSGQWNAGVQDAVASMEGTSGQGGLQVVCAEIEAGGTPSQMSLTGRGVELPGFSGALMLEGQGDGDLSSVDVQAEEVDVEVLMAAWEGQSGNADFGEASGLPLKWSGSIGVLRWGALQATAVSAEGALNAASGEGTIRSVEGKVFGGQVDATGRWNRADIAFNGRLMGAAIPDLLAGTDGLGQATLQPSHVRGKAWADGTLIHRFGMPVDQTWETDLEVRIEEGELLDFELLQRIPETMREEGKYRWLADADDLSRRLRRVRFEPVSTHISLKRGVFNLDETFVRSDAMDVGVVGWQRLSGGMDYTLDFALRDLKSDRDEFGTTEDDGLGHRFFLSIGGTFDEPEFGYDRDAHKTHRRTERRDALGRLRDIISGDGAVPAPDLSGPDSSNSVVKSGVNEVEGKKTVGGRKSTVPDDDDDDYAPK